MSIARRFSKLIGHVFPLVRIILHKCVGLIGLSLAFRCASSTLIVSSPCGVKGIFSIVPSPFNQSSLSLSPFALALFNSCYGSVALLLQSDPPRPAPNRCHNNTLPTPAGAEPLSAGNVGQEILQCTNTEVTLLHGPNGLSGSAAS